MFTTHRTTRRYVLLALALAAVGAAGCQDFNLLSTQEEVAIGQKVAAQVEQKAKVCPDPAVQQYVREIGDRLARVADRQDVTYRFTVLEDPKQVNAFAAPGGFIYVYTGLLLAAENEAEVAGVLGHEIGHVVAKHSAKAISNQIGLSVLASIALGQNPDAASKLATQLLSGAGMSRMSRTAEYQADHFGVLYSKRAGYDPRGMVSFFSKLEAMKKSNPSAISKLFATHPPTEDRIARVKALISQVGPGGTLGADSYRRRLARLRRSHPSPLRSGSAPAAAAKSLHATGPAHPPGGPAPADRSRPASSRRPQGPPLMTCRNLTKGNVVLSRLTVASTHRTRARGLLGRRSLAADEGILLIPCRSVHMLGMKFPLDIVFLDREMRVCGIHRNVRPGKPFLFNRRAYSTLEMAAGVVAARRIEIGDLIRVIRPQ